MTDEFEDLIGGGPSPPPLEDSPAHVRARAIRSASGGVTFVQLNEIKRPVSPKFLAAVFDMDPATVTKRLIPLDPLDRQGRKTLYDFKEACAYLIEPKMDLEKYIASLDFKKLPHHINQMFWTAKRTKLKYQHEAGDSWNTEDVLTALGRVNMTIKDRTQLLVETMRERAGLTDEQMVVFEQLIDGFQSDLHEKMVAYPQQYQTGSIAGQDEDLVAEGVGA